MEQEKNKKKIVYTVIAVALLLVSAVGLTYAYFAVGYNNNSNINTKANVVKRVDSFTTSGEAELELNVTNAVMKNDEGKDDYSVFQTANDTFTVSLLAGSNTATCTYDLAISSEGDTYTKSTGINNLLEYTIEGSDGNQSFSEINVDSAMSSTITPGASDESGTQVTTGILGHYTISDSYDEGDTQNPTTQTWTITSKFYNLAKNQNDQLNKTFEHHIKVVNVSCTNKVPLKPTIVGQGSLDDIGTEVAIGDEHFYVISSDTDSVTMLAKYNLLVGYKDGFTKTELFSSSDEGYNLQSSTARGLVGENIEILSTLSAAGVVPFSETDYWYDGSKLKPEYGISYPAWVYDDNASIKTYVDEYKNKLEEMGMLIQEARLIKQEELVDLGCDASEQTCITDPVTNNNREWIYSTSYWTGSASDNVYFVSSFSYFMESDSDFDAGDGVRPVITISKDLFN